VDIVAKGGNFLLNAGPGPDGTLDATAYQRLADIGAWMLVNGEAIYATRPLAPYKEGKVCLTQKKDGSRQYLIYLPDEDEPELPSTLWVSRFSTKNIHQIRLLGSNELLEWEAVGKGIAVILPERLRKSTSNKAAWAVEIVSGK
jgi:alpha-L-fucosidase